MVTEQEGPGATGEVSINSSQGCSLRVSQRGSPELNNAVVVQDVQ